MKARVQGQFDFEKELKVSERGVVCLVRNRTTKVRSIYREYTGSGEVYREMQGMECPHLPRIEAVAEKDGRVLVLEEYIPGDTLAFL